MKFNIKYFLFIGSLLLLCSLVVVNNMEHKSKRSASMMETYNSFFANSRGQLNNQEDKKKQISQKHKKNHNKKHKGYRFMTQDDEEAIAAPSAPLKPSAPSAPSAPAASASPAKIGNPNDLILFDWFMISSPAFNNKTLFPDVVLPDGKKSVISTDPEFFRINQVYDISKPDQGPTNKHFWFRLSGANIYYSLSKSDINILGAFKIADITLISNYAESYTGMLKTFCFSVVDDHRIRWRMCTSDEKVSKAWVCRIKQILKLEDENCLKDNEISKDQTKYRDRNITQPIIIIPLPSPICNENWNYQRNGEDWACECKEGLEQSPIDLPRTENAIDSPVRPIFEYDEVSPKSEVTTIESQVKVSEPLKIKLSENSLRIRHEKFGKVVTMDGAVYYAQEIVFHTPSEHTIDGKAYDMEIQIIHYGQTKGDIAKQVILSFLIQKKPGVYNKFLDDLDIFNLPNPLNKERDILTNLYIPKLLYNTDDEDIPVMNPFSFYTYQGSLTAPPCTENTIIFVASKPIELGSTAIQLFQEALRIPDIMNEKGDVILSDWIPMSNRNIQPLNGRPVFFYNHEKYCGPDADKSKKPPIGHYEKLIKPQINYFYVNSKEPSGLPNAFVVSEKEAKGEGDDTTKN
jgi:carbonic anhydrase